MSELYQLPAGWEWRKLEDLFIVKDGTHDSPKYVQSSGFPLITSKNLSEKGLDFTKISYISKEDYDKINMRSKVDISDLLFAMIGSIGNPVIIKYEPNFAIKNVALFKCKDETSLIEFLRYYLLSQFVVMKMKQEANGATQKFVGLTYLRNFPFPQIPLAEQKRIVQKLDALFERIDKAIALLQKNIYAADNFMNSVLNDVFSNLEQNYNKLSVDELCTKITDGTHSTPSYKDSGVPFLSVKDISNGVINFSNTRFISVDEHKLLSKRCNVEKNDLLYTKVGTTGIAKVVDVNNEFSIFVSIALLKPKHDIIYNKFFQYMLNSPNCYSQAQKLTRGVANRNLVLKDIKGIIFPIPHYQVQQNIVTYLDEVSVQIEQVKSAQQQKMQKLFDLKSSILDQAFHGKL